MIELIHGDIIQLKVDAIVCPAHKHLSKWRGLCARIHEQAGPELEEACQQAVDCPVGGAVITEGYQIPARYIIHTVTPLWTGGDQWGGSTLHVLGDCFRNAAKLAQERQLKTLAFPALGTGISRTPSAMVAHQALEILHPLANNFERLILCLDSPGMLDEWQKTYKNFFDSPA